MDDQRRNTPAEDTEDPAPVMDEWTQKAIRRFQKYGIPNPPEEAIGMLVDAMKNEQFFINRSRNANERLRDLLTMELHGAIRAAFEEAGTGWRVKPAFYPFERPDTIRFVREGTEDSATVRIMGVEVVVAATAQRDE